MKKYSTQLEAIIALHKRGFTCDFHLFGNDLLWIQEKIFVRAGEYSIVECHRFERSPERNTEIVIFGILTHTYHAKGILLNHYSNYTTKTPPVILEKLKESWLYTPQYENA